MANLQSFLFLFLFFLFPFTSSAGESLILPGEEHLANIRQLTFEGENAEGYFSPDGKYLLFQATPRDKECDQIYRMTLESGEVEMVSTGDGVTTCSFFIPGTEEFIYASTHLTGMNCPPKPDKSHGYVWPLHEGYDIFRASLDGTILQQLTDTPGYDAECAVSPDGREIVFCSIRSGDLELYKMKIDGSDLHRLTWTVGYDGGPFFSPGGHYIIYRSHHPRTPDELKQTQFLIDHAEVSPMRLEIWIMDASGANQHQVTDLGAASFGPYMHPDEERIIFSSSYDPEGKYDGQKPNFDLWMIHKDGSGLERVTTYGDFDGFPMFSYDGKYLVFASNRNAKIQGETNLFLAEWVD